MVLSMLLLVAKDAVGDSKNSIG